MLSHHRSIVQKTVPVLQQCGEQITSVFYRQMFQEHPELLNVFNPASQRNGGQPKSLAASILAYAAHIDNLNLLSGMVDQIAHKHVSLEILPEQYPIVGKHLLGAIKTVLGEAATPEILEAWGAAYEQLATVLINREHELYEKGTNQPGGWRGFKPFIVQRRQEEGQAITSFYLVPEDGQPLPPFQAGQYIGIKVRIPGSKFEQIRQYSLSETSNGKSYRISVKREPGPITNLAAPAGLISSYLHNGIQEGDILLVHVPAGCFVINENSSAPVVLISGGVGISPAFCMLKQLAQEGKRQVLFVHATANGSHHAFQKEVRELENKYPLVKSLTYYNRPQETEALSVDYDYAGQITAESLASHLPDGHAEFYYCGSVGFMSAVSSILDTLSVPRGNRYTETFAPDPSFAGALARSEAKQEVLC